MADIGVVNEQIVPFPLELDVGVFALIVDKPTSLNGRFACVVVPSEQWWLS